MAIAARLLVLAACGWAPLIVSADDSGRMTEIRRAWRQRALALRSISVVYEVEFLDAAPSDQTSFALASSTLPSEVLAGMLLQNAREKMKIREEFLADLREQRARVIERQNWLLPAISSDEPFGDHQIEVWNGTTGAILDHYLEKVPHDYADPDIDGLPRRLRRSTSPSLWNRGYRAWWCTGLAPRPDYWNLTQRLHGGDATVEGREWFGGVECVRVRCKHGPHLWLDPNLDYLPRRWHWLEGASRASWNVIENSDFVRCVQPGSRVATWWPTRSIYQSPDEVRLMTLLDLRLNPEVTDDDFVISVEKLPDGVSVSGDGVPARYAVSGDRWDLWEERSLRSHARNARLVDAFKQSSAEHIAPAETQSEPASLPPRAPVDQEPSLVPVAVLAVVAVTLWIRNRQRRRRAATVAWPRD